MGLEAAEQRGAIEAEHFMVATNAAEAAQQLQNPDVEATDQLVAHEPGVEAQPEDAGSAQAVEVALAKMQAEGGLDAHKNRYSGKPASECPFLKSFGQVGLKLIKEIETGAANPERGKTMGEILAEKLKAKLQTQNTVANTQKSTYTEPAKLDIAAVQQATINATEAMQQVEPVYIEVQDHPKLKTLKSLKAQAVLLENIAAHTTVEASPILTPQDATVSKSTHQASKPVVSKAVPLARIVPKAQPAAAPALKIQAPKHQPPKIVAAKVATKNVPTYQPPKVLLRPEVAPINVVTRAEASKPKLQAREVVLPKLSLAPELAIALVQAVDGSLQPNVDVQPIELGLPAVESQNDLFILPSIEVVPASQATEEVNVVQNAGVELPKPTAELAIAEAEFEWPLVTPEQKQKVVTALDVIVESLVAQQASQEIKEVHLLAEQIEPLVVKLFDDLGITPNELIVKSVVQDILALAEERSNAVHSNNFALDQLNNKGTAEHRSLALTVYTHYLKALQQRLARIAVLSKYILSSVTKQAPFGYTTAA